MQAALDDVPFLAGNGFERLRMALPTVLLALLLTLVALQRGGYFAESWGLPTAACGWIVAMVALLGDRQRLRRIELVQLASLFALGAFSLLSALWAPGGLGEALPQAQLLTLDATALAAALMLFRRPTPLVTTVWACLVAISLVGLGTRLFPTNAVGNISDESRLSQPLGYWNSLGLWAVMALLLSAVLASRSRSVILRATAAASSVPCAATLYFTFSRGAWVALATGLLIAIMVDLRRLGLLAWVILIAPWPGIGVLLASRSHGLTGAAPTLEQARHDGASLAAALVLLAIVAASVALSLTHLERRWRIPRAARVAFASFLVVSCALGLAGTTAQFGAPWTIAIRAAHRFDAPPRFGGRDLNGRLFDLSSNGRVALWRLGWQDAKRHPLLGSGAGTYASEWFRNRPLELDATNAHELYLETLAELGPLGLALLLVALGAPLVAARRARRHPLAAGATAAYVAFLVHVAVDWDWQLAAVSLAALSCAATLLIMARDGSSAPFTARTRFAGAAVGFGLAGFALWSLYISYPLGQARDAIDRGKWLSAERHATDAVERAGGSSAVAWQMLGESQTALRKPNAARVSLRVAVRRDPSSWEAWYDLAVVARGSERRTAAANALVMNPLGSETRSLALTVETAAP